MGLDMYLYEEIYVGGKWGSNQDNLKFTVKKGQIQNEKSFDIPINRISTIRLSAGYWRKANQIHNWIIQNCTVDKIDDCKDIYMSTDDLIKLKNTCQQVLDNHTLAQVLLPVQQGFFFGSTEYNEYYFQDLKDTIEIINKLDLSENNFNDFYYSASW